MDLYGVLMLVLLKMITAEQYGGRHNSNESIADASVAIPIADHLIINQQAPTVTDLMVPSPCSPIWLVMIAMAQCLGSRKIHETLGHS